MKKGGDLKAKYRSDEFKLLRKEYSKKRANAVAKAKRLFEAGIKRYLPNIKFPDASTLRDIDDYIDRNSLENSKIAEILKSQIDDYDSFLEKSVSVPKFKQWVKSNPSKSEIGMVNWLSSYGIYEFDSQKLKEWGEVYGEIADKARKIGIGSDEAIQLLNSLNVDMDTVKDALVEGLDRKATRGALTSIFKSYKGNVVNVNDIDAGFIKNSAREAAKLFRFNLK